MAKWTGWYEAYFVADELAAIAITFFAVTVALLLKDTS